MSTLDTCPLCDDEIAPKQVRVNQDIVGCRCGYIVAPLGKLLTEVVSVRRRKNVEGSDSADSHNVVALNEAITTRNSADHSKRGRKVRLGQRQA